MTSRSQSTLVRSAAWTLLATCAVLGQGTVVAQDKTPSPALDESLRERVDDPLSGLVDVFLILREQPAAAIAREVRPAYVERIDAVWRPVREALERIEPLLPERGDRARLAIGRQIAIENELLRPDEREMRRDARRQVASLLAEMRATILAEAWLRCMPVQDRIAAHVRDLSDGRVLARTCVLNALVVRVRTGDLPELLRQHPEIVRAALSGTRETLMDKSTQVIGAGDWTTNDIDGSGQKVAIVDTGVDASHPALLDSSDASIVVASAVRLSNGAQESNFDDDDTDVDDFYGHGTHIAGTIASQDSTYGGVAPGAPLLNAKCFYRTTSGGGTGLDPDIIAATDWALSNGASVLSLSFGGAADTDGTEPLTKFYDAVVHVTGVSVAVASGNAGSGTNTVLSPGDAFNALTVGAFDDRGTTSLSDDIIAGFSSRGPTDDDRRKPDLAAPGVSIRSANETWEGSGADFVNKSGTSMATPHVAAGMALLLDHESDWQPEAVKALLLNSTRNTSPVPTAPDQIWGHGGLDLGRAYTDRDRVETATLTSSGTDVLYFLLDDVAAGDRATLVWNRAVGYASGGRSAGAGAAKALVDLDLFLYGADGDEDDASESEDDPVEQVKASSALGDSVLRVERVGSFPSGETSLDLAVASAADLALVQPPALSVSASAPAVVAGGAQLTFTATVANDGGLPALAPVVALTLPTGWSLAAGSSATRTLADVATGGEAAVTWQVVAPAVTGNGTFDVDVASTCWGETFEADAAQAVVRADVTPPNVDAGPDVELFAHSALAPVVALTLPTGWSLAAGSSATRTLADVATGGEAAVTWQVVAPSVTGNGTFDLDVASTCWGETFEADAAQAVVRADMTPPNVDAGPDVELFAHSALGRTLLLRVTATDDSPGGVAIVWDTDGDGDFTDEGGSAPEGEPLVLFAIGTHQVGVRGTDAVGNVATDTVQIRIRDNAPTAVAGEDVTLFEGTPLALDASGSGDVEGDLDYSWDLGDGTTATTRTLAHAYADQGTYTVTLTVTDSAGQSHQDSFTATVENADPVADAGPDRAVGEGREITLFGSGSDPGASDSLTYLWVVSDGTTATTADLTHVFREDGTYSATLTVTDDEGATASDVVAIEVRNLAPEVSTGEPLLVDEGTTVLLSGTAIDPGVDDTLTYRWNIDGDIIEGAQVSYTFERDGNRRAYLSVTDDDGATGYSSVFVEVRNVPPTFTLPDELTVGIGNRLVHDLEPWDPSAVDRSALRVEWRIVVPGQDGAEEVLASGSGAEITWDAARRVVDGLLVVSVGDDDISVEKVIPFRAVTPAVGDTLSAVFDAALDPTVEKKLLAALFAAAAKSQPGAKRGALRKALRSVRRARKTITQADSAALLLSVDRSLAALDEDLAAGIAPPRSAASVAPSAGTDTAELLVTLPGAGFDSGATRRLSKALLRLRDAERRERPEKKLLKLRLRAAKAAARLSPPGKMADAYAQALATE